MFGQNLKTKERIIKKRTPLGIYVYAPVNQYIPSVISGRTLKVIKTHTKDKRKEFF